MGESSFGCANEKDHGALDSFGFCQRAPAL